MDTMDSLAYSGHPLGENIYSLYQLYLILKNMYILYSLKMEMRLEEFLPDPMQPTGVKWDPLP